MYYQSGLVKTNTGWTLIEALIVISLLAFLLVVTVPYATSWVDHVRVSEAESVLNLGYAKGKALALRNPMGITEDSSGVKGISAGIKLESGTLLVCKGSPTNVDCTDGGNKVVWSHSVPDKVSFNINGNLMTEFGLDNTGQSIDINGLPETLTYTVTRGNESFSDVLR